MDFTRFPDPNATASAMIKPKYAEDGHLDTVTFLAELAGHDEATAKAYGMQSQMPDYLLWTYSAGTPYWAWLADWVGEAKLLSEFLHSFHGGGSEAVKARRVFLAREIKALVKAQAADWKVGFLCHALGDAYAHVHPVDGEITAYGYPEGHGLSFHDPDSIPKHPERYLSYCTALIQALGGSVTSAPFRAFHDGLIDLFDELTATYSSNGKKERAIRNYLRSLTTIRVTEADLEEASKIPVFDDVIAFLTAMQAKARADA